MSEESKTTEKITSVEKVKDPRRVEAGKRLGMISKQAKERKALREREASAVEAKEKNDDWFSPINSIGSPVVLKERGFAVGVGIAGLVGLALYFGYVKKYKSVEKQSVGTIKSKEVEVVSEATSKTKPKRAYKELDTLD